jgi:hypothetical protein
MRNLSIIVLISLTLSCLAPSTVSAATPAGRIDVKFLYLPPGSIDPEYHTAVWLENKSGEIVQTLFVSNDLSGTLFQTEKVCPEWAKNAHWSKAPKAVVDAVTRPTPDVGAGNMSFDLGQLNVAPGTYKFRFAVNINAEYNILFQGDLIVGNAEQELKIETKYAPSKPDIGSDVAKDVQVHYFPAGIKKSN